MHGVLPESFGELGSSGVSGPIVGRVRPDRRARQARSSGASGGCRRLSEIALLGFHSNVLLINYIKIVPPSPRWEAVEILPRSTTKKCGESSFKFSCCLVVTMEIAGAKVASLRSYLAPLQRQMLWRLEMMKIVGPREVASFLALQQLQTQVLWIHLD